MKRREFLIASGAAALAACAPNKPPSQAAPSTTKSSTSSSTASPTSTTTATTEATTVTTPSTTAPTTSTSVDRNGPALFVQHGPRTKQQVALTFHANGDVAMTTALFGVAEARHVPLTIFAVGSWLAANPAMAKRILNGGHELANHTYTHPSLGQVAAALVAVEIAKCRDIIKQLTAQTGGWFRPSGLDVPTELILNEANKAGYPTVIGYDVDPHDYEDPGASEVLARVKAGLQPGSIVSLHTAHQGTLQALPAILDAITAASLQPVTVSTLLA